MLWKITYFIAITTSTAPAAALLYVSFFKWRCIPRAGWTSHHEIRTNFSLSFLFLNSFYLDFRCGLFLFFLWLFIVGWFVCSLLLCFQCYDFSGFYFLFEWLNLKTGGKMGCSWLYHLTLALDQLRHALASVFARLLLPLDCSAAHSDVSTSSAAHASVKRNMFSSLWRIRLALGVATLPRCFTISI